MPPKKLYPLTALLTLTALNLLNYADRNILFAVQPLIQDEFHLSKVQIGYLTSANDEMESRTVIHDWYTRIMLEAAYTELSLAKKDISQAVKAEIGPPG